MVVIRIDQHHDMDQECPVLPAREGRDIFNYLDKIMPYISEYAKNELNEGNFTCPAFHYGIVGALYHFNPRHNAIFAYGRALGENFVNSPKTRIKSKFLGGKRIDGIYWDDAETNLRSQGGKIIPVPQSLPLDLFKQDVDECQFPIVIGFDIDGLYGIDERGSPEKLIGKRLERAQKVIECVSSPVLTLIARSQTPRAYVPPDLIDYLERTVLELFKRKALFHLNGES